MLTDGQPEWRFCSSLLQIWVNNIEYFVWFIVHGRVDNAVECGVWMWLCVATVCLTTATECGVSIWLCVATVCLKPQNVAC